MTIELYRLPGCPYCTKVENTLERLDIPYETHNVPARKSKRDTVFDLTDQYGVPVIVDAQHDVDGMAESNEIVDYLEATYA